MIAIARTQTQTQTPANTRAQTITDDMCGVWTEREDELARIDVAAIARQQIDSGRVAYYFIMRYITRIIILSNT